MIQSGQNSKKCSFCGEDISDISRRCPYCGSLSEASPLQSGEVTAEDDSAVNEVNEVEAMDSDLSIDKEEPYKIAVQSPDRIEALENTGDKKGFNKPLSDKRKVALAALFFLIPGLGQLAGLITALVFINDDEDSERRSFGSALLIPCIAVFFAACLFYLLLALAFRAALRY